MKYYQDSYCHNAGRFVADGGWEVETFDRLAKIRTYIERELEKNELDPQLTSYLAMLCCQVERKNIGKLFLAAQLDQHEWSFTLGQLVDEIYSNYSTYADRIDRWVLSYAEEDLNELALEDLN